MVVYLYPKHNEHFSAIDKVLIVLFMLAWPVLYVVAMLVIMCALCVQGMWHVAIKKGGDIHVRLQATVS